MKCNTFATSSFLPRLMIVIQSGMLAGHHFCRPVAISHRCAVLCRKIPNGVNGIEERLHVVWQEMVISGDNTRITASARNGVSRTM